MPEMAIAALEAGKHVWCEKPMATTLADAERMLRGGEGDPARWRRSATITSRTRWSGMIRTLIDEGAIGDVNHVRVEMDEDFMADPEALFYWKSEATSGHGALDDFGVHPLSLIFVLFGDVGLCSAHGASPMRIVRCRTAAAAAVETHDIATVADANSAGGIPGVDRAQPLGLGPQGSHRSPDLRLERHDRVRSGAHERVQLYVPRAAETQVSAPSWPRRSIRPTTNSSRRRATASASTISRSSSAAN